jgi:ATP-binding cassette subfamily B protein
VKEKSLEWVVSVVRLGGIVIRTFKEAWPGHRLLISLRIALSVAGALVPLLAMWTYSQAIGALAKPELHKIALWYVIGATVAWLLDGLCDVASGLCERLLWQRIVKRFQMLYFERKGALGADQLENPQFRDLVSKAQDRGISPLPNLVDQQFNLLNSLVRMIGALVVVITFDWRLFLVVLVSLIPQLIVDLKHGKTLWDINDGQTEDRRKNSELNRHFYGRTSLLELKLFLNVGYFLKRISALLDEFRMTQEQAERKRHKLLALSEIASSVLIGSTVIVVVLRVITGTATLQEFVFVWGAVAGLQGSLRSVVRCITAQNELALYARDLYAVIDTPSEASLRTGVINCADRVPTIAFEKVTFCYPWSGAGAMILKDVSFKIRPGERVALVGENGAGKTTLIKLLTGVYVPTSGRITIDGVDMCDLDLGSWRKQLAVLFQDYTRYRMPIRELIALGDSSVPLSDQRVTDAARSAGADRFIVDLPQGYRTVPSKDFAGGVDVSGGQDQRLALARVWYRYGKVVILDEPTASLDVLAEEQIFEEIARRPRGETVILITHRFNTIRNADHIIVLDGGRVVEEGTHTQLVSQSGLYATMFQKQAIGYSEPIERSDEE